MAATMMLSVAFSRQMTQLFRTNKYALQQKEDARDYYVIVRALFAPAVEATPDAGSIDAKTRTTLGEIARTCVVEDTSVDPMTVTWNISVRSYFGYGLQSSDGDRT